jgi:hypothetical protein
VSHDQTDRDAVRLLTLSSTDSPLAPQADPGTGGCIDASHKRVALDIGLGGFLLVVGAILAFGVETS